MVAEGKAEAHDKTVDEGKVHDVDFKDAALFGGAGVLGHEVEIEIEMHTTCIDIDSTKLQKESASSQLTPELRELAQIVAEYHYKMPDRSDRVPKKFLHDRIATSGSGRLTQFWQKKSNLPSFAHQSFYDAVPLSKRAPFRQYRNELLETMTAKRGAKVQNKNVGRGTVRDLAKQKKEAMASYLTPELRELAQIAAKCFSEGLDQKGGLPRQVINDKIATFGSYWLKQFWQDKSKLPSVFRRGYLRAVPLAQRAFFRKYRDELLETMAAESDAKIRVNVHCRVDSTKLQKESASSQLPSELRELAKVAAEYFYERSDQNGYGRIPRNVLDDRIRASGSAMLRQFWHEKSKTLSVIDRGYTAAVPLPNLTMFRQYRSELVATMIAESKAAGSLPQLETMVALSRQCRSELVATMAAESKTDVENKNVGEGADMFGHGEVAMHSDSSKQNIESTSSGLTPELEELAQIAAKCLSERRTGNNFGGVSMQIIHARITTFGSKELKVLWQKKANIKSFSGKGYTDAVPSTKLKLFRKHRGGLLAKMMGNEGNVAAHVENVDEEMTICTDKSVHSAKCVADTQRTNPSLPVGSPSRMPPDLEELARLVAECKGVNSNNLCHHETLALKVLSSGCQILKDRWNGVAKLSRFQRDGYSMLIPQSMRISFHIYLDNFISSCNNGAKGQSVATAAAKQNPELACHLKKPPSLPVDSPSILPPDLEELARLVTECMGGNSNNVCHETLALKVLSSECQMLKDRWNGMARLSRFQRDGYSMLIPRGMRESFQIHCDHLLSSWHEGNTNGLMATSSAAKQLLPKLTTGHLKKALSDVTPSSQTKPNQLAGAATITPLSFTRNYHEGEDLAYNEAQQQCEDIMSGDSSTDRYHPDENTDFLERIDNLLSSWHKGGGTNNNNNGQASAALPKLTTDDGHLMAATLPDVTPSSAQQTTPLTGAATTITATSVTRNYQEAEDLGYNEAQQGDEDIIRNGDSFTARYLPSTDLLETTAANNRKRCSTSLFCSTNEHHQHHRDGGDDAIREEQPKTKRLKTTSETVVVPSSAQMILIPVQQGELCQQQQQQQQQHDNIIDCPLYFASTWIELASRDQFLDAESKKRGG